MVRLFEFVTLEHNYLPDQFKPLDDPVDEKNSLKILHNIKHIKDKIYEATCPYDVENRCVFKFDSSFCVTYYLNVPIQYRCMYPKYSSTPNTQIYLMINI